MQRRDLLELSPALALAAGLTSNLPISGGAGIQAFVAEGYPSPKGTALTTNSQAVSSDLFRSLNVPLLRGRFFSEDDGPHT